jgi:putative ABC transport system ATP-binding protein
MSKIVRNTIIIAEHLTKELVGPAGRLTILDDINFELERSTSCAIVGASGSGKSTLLGLLAGLDTPTRGRCVIAGEDLSRLDEDARARLRNQYIGFVFQQFHLLPTLTALENVALPLEFSTRVHADDAAGAALARVGLSARADHLPSQLSGGEQQRVALARALCTNAQLILADEPTGNLDAKTATQIIELLFEIKAEMATTLVLVTHDERLARRCERQLILEAGRLRDD